MIDVQEVILPKAIKGLQEYETLEVPHHILTKVPLLFLIVGPGLFYDGVLQLFLFHTLERFFVVLQGKREGLLEGLSQPWQIPLVRVTLLIGVLCDDPFPYLFYHVEHHLL